MPPRAASALGFEDPAPGLMSLTRYVPNAWPSVLQSSTPDASLAGRYRMPPTAALLYGKDDEVPGLLEADPGLMSLRSVTRGPSALTVAGVNASVATTTIAK